MDKEIKVKIVLDDTEFTEKMNNAIAKTKELKKALDELTSPKAIITIKNGGIDNIEYGHLGEELAKKMKGIKKENTIKPVVLGLDYI